MSGRTVTLCINTTNAGLTAAMGIASIPSMSNEISRRDFMNGVAIAIVGALGTDLTGAHATDSTLAAAPAGAAVAGAAGAATAPGPTAADAYPPSRAGLRGSHPGSFEAAHRLRDGSGFDLSHALVTEHYDLVVVGAGISGLAAAHFYRQRRLDARVLVLDTNDDFGGHAKRNEFNVDGRTLIGYGGTQSIDGPMHKWLLWDQAWMIRQLYRLREVGLLSKVSEIDRMRQFTTKYNLAEAIGPIVALLKETP